MTGIIAPGTTARSKVFYRWLPKVELHRHLEGSLRLETMVEVARSHGLSILGTGHLRSLVQVHEDDPYTFQNFLSKFETLRLFYRSPDIIGRITREAIADAAEDNVRYLELRFTPMALSFSQGFTLSEVMDWVIEHSQKASQEHNITTRLIVSVNRHESVRVAEEVLRLSVDRKTRGVIGFDLAGNESEFPMYPFAGVFRDARQEGMHITVHAGEWGGAQNVIDAINLLGAERIGHGVRVLEDARAVDLARERQTTFEVCITSNHHSGVVPVDRPHPILEMMARGLNVTLNTDDPSISQITLGCEYYKACEEMKISPEMLRDCVLAAAKATFISDQERASLSGSLAEEYSQWV